MINEHASVVLTKPIPKSGLEAGDVGVVVHVHRKGEAYEVEFMTLDGTPLRSLRIKSGISRMYGKRSLPKLASHIS